MSEEHDPLESPCIFCGYDSFGYWNEASHARDCPWFFIGSKRERAIRLRGAIEALNTRAKPEYKYANEDHLWFSSAYIQVQFGAEAKSVFNLVFNAARETK